MIAVTCPAGQVTAILVPRLLRRGHPVRVLCRSARDLDRLTALGAQVRRGDLTVPGDLDRWLREAAASCITIPLARDPQEELGMARSLARAHRASSVAHIVLISLAGTQTDSVAPALAVKAEIEQVLADSGRDFTCLRTGLRMDILGLLRRELESGRLPLPVPPTALLPMVAARDIAQAALALLARGPAGGVERVALLGPELITPAAMAADLSAAWGHGIEAVQVSGAEHARRLTEAGLAPERAAHLTQFIVDLAAAAEDPETLAGNAEGPPAELGQGTRFADFAPLLAGVPPAPARY
jgi:uncharacterized protein YbjT (DUF2867 family)